MTAAAKSRRRLRHRAKHGGLDHSLLPGVIVQHYGPGIGAVSPEVLLAAWSWYERGRADGLATGEITLAAERERLESWCQRVVAAGATAQSLSRAAGNESTGSTPKPSTWKPLPPTFPPGHGEVYNPGERPVEKADAALDDFTVSTAVEGTAEDAPPPDDPRYAGIGHYTANEVAPYIRHAEAISKDPAFGVRVSRELLSDDEKRCREIPGSFVGQLEAKLRKHNMLRGEDWTKMEEV